MRDNRESEQKHMCAPTRAGMCVAACVRLRTPVYAFADDGASRLCPCCLKWGSVILIELNEWSRTPLHLSDPAAPALLPQIPAPTPDAPAPSKEQLANGQPIKEARPTGPQRERGWR